MRGSQGILDAVESTASPLRLLLDNFAFDAAIKRCDDQRKQSEQWRDATLDADFPDANGDGPK